MGRRRDKEDWSGNVNSEIAYMPLQLELTRQRRRHLTRAPRVERGADESFGGDAERPAWHGLFMQPDMKAEGHAVRAGILAVWQRNAGRRVRISQNFPCVLTSPRDIHQIAPVLTRTLS